MALLASESVRERMARAMEDGPSRPSAGDVVDLVCELSGVAAEDIVDTRLRTAPISRARAVVFTALRACLGMTYAEASRAVMGELNHNVTRKGCARIVAAIAATRPRAKLQRDAELWGRVSTEMSGMGWPPVMTRLAVEDQHGVEPDGMGRNWERCAAQSDPQSGEEQP